MQVSLARKGLLVLLLAAIATLVLLPLSSNTAIPNIQDYFNHITAIVQAKMALAEGQFPLRVMPLQYDGLRYPYFQFYSPTSHLIAAFVYRWLTPSNPYLAYKFTIWCALVCGGIYMYRLAFWLVNSFAAALLASVVYLTSPYYIIVVDHLGAFNEAIALGILPAVLFYTLKRFYFPAENKTLLQASLAWYLLATVHTITFFYASIFSAILLIHGTLKNHRYLKNLMGVGIAYGLACLLAMWFLGPLVLTEKYLVIASQYGISYLFDNYHPSILSLISPTQIFSTGLKDNNISTRIHPGLGLPMLMAAGFCLYVILSRKHSNNKIADFWILPLVTLFLIVFFMIWSPINFWRWLPHTMAICQYSMRLTGQIMWIGALLFAWAFARLFQDKPGYQYILLGVFLSVLSTSAWYSLPEIQLAPIKMPDMVANPVVYWKFDYYRIDEQKTTSLKKVSDNFLLNLSGLDNELIANKIYYFPKSIFKNAIAPYISLLANFPEKIPPNIQVIIDGKPVVSYAGQAGEFRWHIPIDLQKNIQPNEEFSLQFKINDAADNIKMKVKKLLIGGFIDPATTITLEQARPHCKMQEDVTVCEIEASANTKLIELPILYYPKLLRVTLNGEPVNYTSVMNDNQLIAAIKANPSEINVIKMQFVGLPWANWVSLFSGLLWLAILVWMKLKEIILRMMLNKFEDETAL